MGRSSRNKSRTLRELSICGRHLKDTEAEPTVVDCDKLIQTTEAEGNEGAGRNPLYWYHYECL